MGIKRQIEAASEEISKWPAWKQEAYGHKPMTKQSVKDLLKSTLEEGKQNTLGLCKKLGFDEVATNNCIGSFDQALAAVGRGEVSTTWNGNETYFVIPEEQS